jgi:O-antigen/teichoic acid export membrane protein
MPRELSAVFHRGWRSRLDGWLSDEGLTRKAYLNAFASVLDYVARATLSFVLNPLILDGLGRYAYGIFQILGRLNGYVSATSGRPTQALKWMIAYRQGSTDYEAKRRNVGSAVVVWLLFLPVMAVCGGALAWFAPSFIGVPAPLTWTVRAAALVLLADLIFGGLAEIPQSVLRGANLGYKRMGLSALLVFSGGALTWLALYTESGLVGVAAAQLTTTLLAGLVFLGVVRSQVTWFGISRPTPGLVRQFLTLSIWFVIWRLVMQIMMASDVVILGMLDSVEIVTTYTLTKYMPETLVSLVGVLVLGVTPGLGGIIGSGETRKAARVRAEIMTVTWLVATIVGTTILMWNGTFVRLWVGRDYYAGPIAGLLIMLMTTQLVVIRNDANIIDLTLDLRLKVLVGAISAALSVLLAMWLLVVMRAGVTGLCVGFIAGRIVLTVAYPYRVGRVLGMSWGSQVRSVIRPTVVMAVLFGFAQWVATRTVVNDWVTLIAAVSGTVLVAAVSGWFGGLSVEQRRSLRRRMISGLALG